MGLFEAVAIGAFFAAGSVAVLLLTGVSDFETQRPPGRFFFGLATAAGLEPATLSFEG